MMKASTQLIGDFQREWDPSHATSRKDFNFVIGELTIAVFWKPLAFFGQPKWCCDLRIARECSGDLLRPSPPAACAFIDTAATVALRAMAHEKVRSTVP
jgi:hypothetical protein